jgi:hypothetical protein
MANSLLFYRPAPRTIFFSIPDFRPNEQLGRCINSHARSWHLRDTGGCRMLFFKQSHCNLTTTRGLNKRNKRDNVNPLSFLALKIPLPIGKGIFQSVKEPQFSLSENWGSLTD